MEVPMTELFSALVAVYGLGVVASKYIGKAPTWSYAAAWPLRLFAKPEA
jgi:hypothetical protein